MDKYLFNDGTNVIREVQSKEELELLAQSAIDRNKIRVWVFNTSEWLTYAEYSKRAGIKPTNIPQKEKNKAIEKTETVKPLRKSRSGNWLRNGFVAALAVVTIILIYNFTRVTWTRITPLNIRAQRPANTPPVDADSLIQAIEWTRGQKLDKVTKTNLRIRNTWPDRVVLQLTAERDSSSNNATKAHHIEISVDNSTGYFIDEAIVELRTWKDERIASTDTFHFRNINYAQPARRILEREYRVDSMEVSFNSIRAKSFNFCYSSGKESNYGNLNDRWFCK